MTVSIPSPLKEEVRQRTLRPAKNKARIPVIRKPVVFMTHFSSPFQEVFYKLLILNDLSHPQTSPVRVQIADSVTLRALRAWKRRSSTPHKRSVQNSPFYIHNSQFSFHAPAWEATGRPFGQIPGTSTGFNPRPRKGGDTPGHGSNRVRRRSFNPRPRKGGDDWRL